MTDIFKKYESNVRSYCRSFPVKFKKAKNDTLTTSDGDEYIDFLAGAGTLNYGHNNSKIKKKVIKYLESDGPIHGLDMMTEAKEDFISNFVSLILQKRNMKYKMQFPGPTGTNAVEAALKIARKVTGRQNVISFTNGFHGCTLGAAAITGNSHFRNGTGVSLPNTTFMPFEGFLGQSVDTTDVLVRMLEDTSSGLDKPAAIILETVQGEGGLNAASKKWLQRIERICRTFDILFIVDDIQAGCGRTGKFFSFEDMGISPDIVTLSKSLSGYGLPMSLIIMKEKLDIWKPGEHNGTFRGHNLAFVAATAALKEYWKDKSFEETISNKSQIVKNHFQKIIDSSKSGKMRIKGRGMMIGLDCRNGDFAGKVAALCFKKKLIIERSGTNDEIVKCLAPLTISESKLKMGLDIIAESVTEVSKTMKPEKILSIV
ncbi:MAG: diaminobutyrate--2-oxoglutarate transaminase [Lentisphaeraceae bacterium]|nr:diaminobutyrate--2-oxoglutarate transaminase [Lentisphaeraceae bacterium]